MLSRNTSSTTLFLLVILAITAVNGFSSTSTSTSSSSRMSNTYGRSLSTPSSSSSISNNNNDNNNLIQLRSTSTTSINIDDGIEFIQYTDKKTSDDWELDCYSRPVVAPGGKKLWEVLITDSTGSFRFVKTLPSNKVNSKEVRQTVEDLMEDPRIESKPSTIRFFRGAMFNMINIALSELDVVSRPSRGTYSIAQWLEERHKDVYPKMEG
ncbi:MAG: hypothetical protein ACI8RD_010475 [Bacillariaceae sp.]|jgi:hypothetical protein